LVIVAIDGRSRRGCIGHPILPNLIDAVKGKYRSEGAAVPLM
jgi:hypothetical protein